MRGVQPLQLRVIPAQAGTHKLKRWIPVFTGMTVGSSLLKIRYYLGKPQKVFQIAITQNCGFLQVKAGFAPFYFQKLSRFYLGKPQKVFQIAITQNCGFLQVKAGFAPFYFQKLSRFYLIEQDKTRKNIIVRKFNGTRHRFCFRPTALRNCRKFMD
jgi:hypothetical protein